jgi:hypothetical protein
MMKQRREITAEVEWPGLDEKVSLYDVLGQGYTLIRLDPALQPSSLIHAAASRGVPLTILDVNEANARPPLLEVV